MIDKGGEIFLRPLDKGILRPVTPSAFRKRYAFSKVICQHHQPHDVSNKCLVLRREWPLKKRSQPLNGKTHIVSYHDFAIIALFISWKLRFQLMNHHLLVIGQSEVIGETEILR